MLLCQAQKAKKPQKNKKMCGSVEEEEEVCQRTCTKNKSVVAAGWLAGAAQRVLPLSQRQASKSFACVRACVCMQTKKIKPRQAKHQQRRRNKSKPSVVLGSNSKSKEQQRLASRQASKKRLCGIFAQGDPATPAFLFWNTQKNLTRHGSQHEKM